MKRSILFAALSLSLAAPALAMPVNPRVTGMHAQGFAVHAMHVSRKAAIQIALQATGGGTVTEIHKDDFHDRPTWSINILNSPFKYQVDVDRQTGDILRMRKQRA